MKKLGCLAFAAVLGLMIVGCASSQRKLATKDMKNLSYENQSNGDLELINQTPYDLVIFAGSIHRNNILGGIRKDGVGSTRFFDFSPFVSSKTGAFLCRAVKADVYEAKGGYVTEDDVIFAKLVTYGDNIKSSFRITGEVGGMSKLLFENASPYPVELRLNGTDGAVLTTLPPNAKEKYVYVDYNSRGYVYFPTYLMYDKSSGKMSSISAKEEDALVSRPARENETPQTVIVPMPNSKMYGSRVAYLTVRNESGRAFIMRNDNTEIFSQTGNTMINSGETLTFEVDSKEEGRVFRAINADFRVGDVSKRYVKFFEGEPTVLKAGVEYEISVFNQNGLVKAIIDNSSERVVEYNLNSQLELE